MAGSTMYAKILPDYTDLNNSGGNKPGYKVYILERDGGVSIQMQDADDNSDSDTLKATFMNVKEAKEFCKGLEEAIELASTKKANNKNRAKEIE